MKANKHHIISGQGLDKGRMTIEPNSQEYLNSMFSVRHGSTFDKQLDRPPIISEKCGPNENRFVTLKVPSKSSKSAAVDFEKMSNRDKGSIYSSV